VIAANTPARMARGAVEAARREGIAAGLFTPMTLWPFPIDALAPLVERARDVLVVEASLGQLEDEVRLALSHRGVEGIRFHHLRHLGGVLPQEREILSRIREVRS
jgi:pyruvate/2-oxoacid:ferredoxin oxidoreductase alpha subunit